jgi:DNA-binding transcriptional MerR regulator
MKNWLTIGQFSKEVSLSQRALRVYETLGLISAHTRGENKYRYYTTEQIELVERIKKFKSLGFSLEEIRSLLEVDTSMNSDKLESLLETRLQAVKVQREGLNTQENLIESVLTSLRKNKQGLGPHERRFIMSQFDKTSVVVAGVSDLDKTAHYIRGHILDGGKDIPVTVWDGISPLPHKKPFILIVSENLLHKPEVGSLAPDIVVIKELSQSSVDIQNAYMQLYGSVGPHMTTVLNADDRAVIELAGNERLRQGRTYYFSKNSGLQPQISKIGGVISDGEEVEIYGFNKSKGPLEMSLKRIMGMGEEMAFLASLAAVMDFGLNEEAIIASTP